MLKRESNKIQKTKIYESEERLVCWALRVETNIITLDN